MNRKKVCAVVAVCLVALAATFCPQDNRAQTNSAAEIVLVLPFENTSEQHPEFNWIGESFADSLSSLLDKPGLIVVSSDERAVAYQRLRLPQTVIPSRATAIKIARELKASMIVFGTYRITMSPAPASTDKSKPAEASIASIMGQAKVIRVNEGRLAGEIFDGSWAPRQYDFADSIKELQKVHGELAYQILFQRDRALSFSRNNLIQEATKVPPQAFEAYMKGSMTAERDSTRAIYFKNALKLYGKDNGGAVYPAAAFELGRFYFDQKQWKEAVEYFMMLQKKDPHYNEGQFYAGLAYWKTGDLAHAVTTLVPLADEKAMPLVGVYNNAGAVSTEAARNEKKPEERTRLLNQGITLLSRASDSSPDDATVLFNLGYALFLSEKYADAAARLEKVIASNQTDGEAYFLLAKAQTRANHAEAASAADNLARKNLPGQYAKWEMEWQKSASVNNLNLRSRDVLNQVDVSDLSRFRLIEAANANVAQEELAKIRELYQQGRDDEALVEIRKLFNIEPTNAEAFLIIGRINQRRGDQTAAIASLKTAIFWESTHPLIDAHILLGRIFLERGDLSEAKKYAASAMAIDPDNQEAMALQRQVNMGKP